MYYARDAVIPSVSAMPAAPRSAAPRRIAARTPERKPIAAPAHPREQPRYVVQLRLSPTPFDPARVPHHDILDLYHLYTEVTLERGQVRHALRLGFFKDAQTAGTVARYLQSYFESPSVLRIDGAEVVRSRQRRIAPREDVGASGVHAVIELMSTELPAAELVRPARGASDDRAARASLWSRLFSQR